LRWSLVFLGPFQAHLIGSTIASQPLKLLEGHVLISKAVSHRPWMLQRLDSRTHRSTRFYVEQLGFKVRPAKPLQDGRPFTAFRQGIAIVQGRKTGERQIDHIAFEVNNVRSLRDKLKANQVEFFQDLHDGPYGLTIYIADPDGTKVELYQVGEKA
jgi:Glyoxalase/Bleomycin resistance protein/Dioxygenase superfamily